MQNAPAQPGEGAPITVCQREGTTAAPPSHKEMPRRNRPSDATAASPASQAGTPWRDEPVKHSRRPLANERPSYASAAAMSASGVVVGRMP